MKGDRASDGEIHLYPMIIPSDRPHSFIRGSHSKPWPLLTSLSLALNVKLATSAMTKIGQVSRVRHKHKLRSPHRQRQKRVPSVCHSFLHDTRAIRHRRSLSDLGCVHSCSSNHISHRYFYTHIHRSPPWLVGLASVAERICFPS